ncbi:MAG: hypothetical protein A2W52_01595 [Candidatus Taylorbacteria bacterium RIFCSPHIGHO2_02_49_25]|uniref:Uncharacterized protein n=1 Tax=Candidatus Taylorbacteria bacterium RIFCSPHIGHO2_02_49_25 TaxID=1802305 RepID=A0A1G2MGI1_9BACT|nr:MAG: hypothetical protein A2759_02640 [Candidatus Taylorbacteria bacterium RIFCSPHIGHO2_01_FULL_49_60]OHA22102.1 MAG: hypothetical protein A2W52_01595 [Candidatus Taylorbacteria bacterium RIFCSPHIGHO2_02_49_25]OHA35951.1 MAG: hypothetical protein A2W65_02490 [Candidatus Taylorbacteria bacterium RIFCSPLOWO2_02_50_13]OHA41770.1 MAG: hypothetical protein A3H73_04005 [Candidatus Taylorbacteria bacterium RIFCSPLOWO2_02_FULL_50_120]OHA47548.1 MAG: hypothetical protein A3G61_03485 [Candidatus Taylo
MRNIKFRTYAFASQFSLGKGSTRLTFQKKLGGGWILWLYSELEILLPPATSPPAPSLLPALKLRQAGRRGQALEKKE